MPEDCRFDIKPDVLRALATARVAAPAPDTHPRSESGLPVPAGLILSVTPDAVRMIATDVTRLACTTWAHGAPGGNLTVVIERSDVTGMLQAILGLKDLLTVTIEVPSLRLTIRNVDGNTIFDCTARDGEDYSMLPGVIDNAEPSPVQSFQVPMTCLWPVTMLCPGGPKARRSLMFELCGDRIRISGNSAYTPVRWQYVTLGLITGVAAVSV